MADSGARFPGVLGDIGSPRTSPTLTDPNPGGAVPTRSADGRPKWAKVIDQTVCIGCHACTTACRSENEVPLGVTRTYVKSVEVGTWPAAHRAFQVTRCNQCDDAPCVAACPTSAMYRRGDGIVDFDKRICIGCKACIAACPYDAIFINPHDHSAEKCNFCAHRLDVGLEPACVVVCPTEAILVGDLNDSRSRVAEIVGRAPVTVRRPEKETGPKLFYTGAHQATLDPIAARRPAAGLYMWSEQGPGVSSGHPGPFPNSSAAALVSYDVPHRAPWDWRVSLYTWTKSISAGAYLVALLLAIAGVIGWSEGLIVWTAPVLALVALVATGIVLVVDLDHPERFFYLLTRPQWRSWLVKGAVILIGYGAVLALHLVAGVAGSDTFRQVLAIPGVALSVMAAVYTAYLFAQSKARDLWQSPLLPPHIAVQAVMAGAAALLVAVGGTGGAASEALAWIVAGAALAHLLMVWGEVTLGHATAHSHLAVREMTGGRFRRWFWSGVGLVAIGLVAPWIGVWAAPAVLAGLLSHEHAYVQSAQWVPLA